MCRWKGYRDCVDVDYFLFPVEHIHGEPIDMPEWRRIDHCSINRVRQIVTPAHAVSDNAESCIEYIQERYWTGGGASGRRMGINVARLSYIMWWHSSFFTHPFAPLLATFCTRPTAGIL